MNKYFAVAVLVLLIESACVARRTVVVREPVPTPPPVVVSQPPPPPVVEPTGRPPGPNHVWVSGNYEWNGRRYLWHRGHWARRPHVRAVYIEGHWEQRPGGWVWIPGRWQ